LYPTWGRDDVAAFPDRGEQPRWSSAWPPPGGCRLTVFELPPGDSEEFDQFILNTLRPFAAGDAALQDVNVFGVVDLDGDVRVLLGEEIGDTPGVGRRGAVAVQGVQPLG